MDGELFLLISACVALGLKDVTECREIIQHKDPHVRGAHVLGLGLL